MKPRLWPTYLFCAALGAAAYLFLSAHPQWTLFPYAKILNILFGYHFSYAGDCYQAMGSGVVISQTCSGVNLFASVYGILVFGFLRRFPGASKRFSAALACFGIALAVAFAATLARIILSLPFCESRHFKLIHTVFSLCVFYGTGLWVYLCAQKIMRRFPNETSKVV